MFPLTRIENISKLPLFFSVIYRRGAA